MNFDASALTSDAVVIMSVALFVRALAAFVQRLGESMPKIVDAIASALKKRAEAKRLEASARVTEAAAKQTSATSGAAALEREATARAELEGRVRGMQHRLFDLAEAMAEQARLATAEIEEAHRTTATAMGALEQLRMDAAAERIRCDAAIAAMRAEMEDAINRMTSGHSTPASRRST